MLGGEILNFFGGTVRWIYGTTWRTIANKPGFKYREYLYGSENSEDWFDLTGHTFVNKIIGIITILLICWLIFKI